MSALCHVTVSLLFEFTASGRTYVVHPMNATNASISTPTEDTNDGSDGERQTPDPLILLVILGSIVIMGALCCLVWCCWMRGSDKQKTNNKEKESALLVELIPDEKTSNNVMNAGSYQPPTQKIEVATDSEMEIKTVPPVGNNREMGSNDDKKEEKESIEEREVKKEQPKMKGKVAAKFAHLNIDPSKLKVGAAPPPKKKNSSDTVEESERKKSIDQTANMSKVSMSKTKRKQKKRKKLNLDELNAQ